MNSIEWLDSLGVDLTCRPGGALEVRSPMDGAIIAQVSIDTKDSADAAIEGSKQAFEQWRTVPAPRRGELMRVFGQALRSHKED